ncbi:GTA-gp10 family protein [Bradyrhizobium sp. CCBAU 25338]|uniref:GTA-gp10 family protein n=1 Tax=Bradyrhizobium sp. CCBAU 25338 TaxID=1641877 RepID=UPI0023023190|nr:GTA-gp10 family protein [Bradyrhizobium sp. CCBAU 25338]
MTDDKCAREINWAGGTHTFTLADRWVQRVISWRGINGYSPSAALARFETGSYTADDVERVIELGLLGGGVPESEVETLLNSHVRGKPLNPNVLLANAVLAALFSGDAQ